MKTLLTTAIDQRRLVHLLYEGESKTVQPYVLGRNQEQELVFLGKQVSPWLPEEQRWQVFRLNKIYGLVLLETRAGQPREPVALPAEKLSGIRFLV